MPCFYLHYKTLDCFGTIGIAEGLRMEISTLKSKNSIPEVINEMYLAQKENLF